MKKSYPLRLCALSALLATATTMAFADTEVFIDEVEGWSIYRGAEDLGCIMERTMDDGYLVRLGKEKAGAPFGYIGVYTQDPNVKIYGGVTGDVVLDIDGQRFTGTAVGDLDFRDGYRGAYMKANNPQFGEALARKYVLTLNPDENPIKISLDGTLKAMSATELCDEYGVASMDLADTAKLSQLETDALASWNSLLDGNNRAARYADEAVAVMVFPEIKKAGLVVGGEAGNGVLFKDGQVLGHYRTSSLSVGAQAGAQSYGYAVMFLDEQAYERFFSRKRLELGVDASVAVFRAGITAEVDTTKTKVDTVAFVYDEEGLMANWTIEGTRIRELEQ